MSNRKETVCAVLIMGLLIMLTLSCAITVRQENTCWDSGYDTPVNYMGDMYCLGKDGEPVMILMSELPN